jgi:hypothetical protein
MNKQILSKQSIPQQTGEKVMKPVYTLGCPMVMATSSPSLGLEGAGTCSPVILEYINRILTSLNKGMD